MVETKTRRILGFDVASMPAKGLLAKISIKKYGKRLDERDPVMQNLLKSMQPYVSEKADITSDQNPHYQKL